MDIWTVPLIIVILIICMIGSISARKGHRKETVTQGGDSPIPETVEAHPFTLNPIIWIILIAAFFTGIVIFYYAASSY